MKKENLKDVLKRKVLGETKTKNERDEKIKILMSTTVDNIIEELMYGDKAYIETILDDNDFMVSTFELKLVPPDNRVLYSYHLNIREYIDILSDSLKNELEAFDVIRPNVDRLELRQNDNGKISIRFTVVFEKEKETEEDV